MRCTAILVVVLSLACGVETGRYSPPVGAEPVVDAGPDLPPCQTRDDVGNEFPRELVDEDYLRQCEALNECWLANCYRCVLGGNQRPTWEIVSDNQSCGW